VDLLLKPIYLVYRILSGLRYWTQRRLNPAGFVVVLAFMATGLLGLDTENTVAYQGFTLLLSLLLVAACFSWRFRGRFSLVRALPKFGTVGQPLHYKIRLTNLTDKPQAGLVLMENIADPRPTYADWRAILLAEQRQSRSFRVSHQPIRFDFRVAAIPDVPLPILSPRQEAETQVSVTPARRGILRFTGSTLARSDPLGLLRSFIRLNQPQALLILPKRYALPPLAAPGAMKYQQGGVALASSIGQSDEFISLRDYRNGDPLRHIHWRSWAKTDKPVVKEFEDEFFVRHALVLDTFMEHPRSEIFEEAVSVAASFACTLQTQESLLDLLFVGPESYCFTAGRGVAHGDQMLEILASVKPCREHPFETLENLVLEHVTVVSGCACVLLAWDATRHQFVRKLRELAVPLRVFVIVPPGAGDKVNPGPMHDEPQNFHVLEVGRIEQGLARLK
jgi:uncharacterized protein (DUF58 family)